MVTLPGAPPSVEAYRSTFDITPPEIVTVVGSEVGVTSLVRVAAVWRIAG